MSAVGRLLVRLDGGKPDRLDAVLRRFSLRLNIPILAGRIERLSVSMLSRELILELMYWTPLIALLLSSLGLIALRRISALPPWAERLMAPPFYLVSLPIATLIVGVEMLIWVIHFFLSGPLEIDSWRLLFVGNLLLFMLATSPVLAILVLVILGYGLFAALVFSSLMLGRGVLG